MYTSFVLACTGQCSFLVLAIGSAELQLSTHFPQLCKSVTMATDLGMCTSTTSTAILDVHVTTCNVLHPAQLTFEINDIHGDRNISCLSTAAS